MWVCGILSRKVNNLTSLVERISRRRPCPAKVKDHTLFPFCSVSPVSKLKGCNYFCKSPRLSK